MFTRVRHNVERISVVVCVWDASEKIGVGDQKLSIFGALAHPEVCFE